MRSRGLARMYRVSLGGMRFVDHVTFLPDLGHYQ